MSLVKVFGHGSGILNGLLNCVKCFFWFFLTGAPKMLAAQGVRRMEKKELNDLLRLKGWSRTQLAGALDMTEAAIHSWFRGDRDPRGPAVILMRLWLREARGEIRIVEVEKLEPVPA